MMINFIPLNNVNVSINTHQMAHQVLDSILCFTAHNHGIFTICSSYTRIINFISVTFSIYYISMKQNMKMFKVEFQYLNFPITSS